MDRPFEAPHKKIVSVSTFKPTEHNYICAYCTKGFERKDNLKSHMKTHGYIQKRYGCDFCDKAYLYASNLKVHIKLVHTEALATQNEVYIYIHTI